MGLAAKRAKANPKAAEQRFNAGIRLGNRDARLPPHDHNPIHVYSNETDPK